MRLGLLALLPCWRLEASKLPYVEKLLGLEELLPTEDTDSLARSSCLFLRFGMAIEEDMFVIQIKPPRKVGNCQGHYITEETEVMERSRHPTFKSQPQGESDMRSSQSRCSTHLPPADQRASGRACDRHGRVR
jgi:hypothetical protein